MGISIILSHMLSFKFGKYITPEAWEDKLPFDLDENLAKCMKYSFDLVGNVSKCRKYHREQFCNRSKSGRSLGLTCVYRLKNGASLLG